MFERIKQGLDDAPLATAGGSHSLRLKRVIVNIEDAAQPDQVDDRLLHLMSRVGTFVRDLAKDRKAGVLEEAQLLAMLEALADVGDECFEHWLGK